MQTRLGILVLRAFLRCQGEDHLLPILPKGPVRLDNSYRTLKSDTARTLAALMVKTTSAATWVSETKSKYCERTERQSEIDGQGINEML